MPDGEVTFKVTIKGPNNLPDADDIKLVLTQEIAEPIGGSAWTVEVELLGEDSMPFIA